MHAKIVVLAGDGIGKEVCQQAERALATVGEKYDHHFAFEHHLIGGIAIEKTGVPLPPATVEACQSADAILLGAVGDPRWNDPLLKIRPEQGLLDLRKEMNVFCNLRPVKVFPGTIHLSPLREDRLTNVDFLVVRELTGGLYFGKPRRLENYQDGWRAVDTMVYTDKEIERITRKAFEFAGKRKKKVTSIDKANVLECSRLWRRVVTEIAQEYPDIELDHMLVDSAAMRLISNPDQFDVILTENMFGDILTDEASVLSGSLGLLPSASVGGGTNGIFEPIHGSAPDIAGLNIANPVGTILSSAMLLRFSLSLEKEADEIEQAIEHVFVAGHFTHDLGGTLSTTEIGDEIINILERAI